MRVSRFDSMPRKRGKKLCLLRCASISETPTLYGGVIVLRECRRTKKIYCNLNCVRFVKDVYDTLCISLL